MSTPIEGEVMVDVHFPLAGIDESQPFYDQRPRQVREGLYARSTPEASNVVGFEPSTDRARGGSRPGLVRQRNDRPADFVIQDLTWISTSGSTVQLSNSGRVVKEVTVVQGNVYYAAPEDDVWTAATNATGDTPPLAYTGVIFSSVLGENLFFADGNNQVYFNARINTVSRWTASAGSLPVDDENNNPRLIETWRGRMLQSGLLLDPTNIFASRVGDATDWDYFPDEDAQGPDQAWALGVGPQGKMADFVRSMCPYTDDVCIVWCDSSIYTISGDPANGGQIDLVTKAIGGTWGRCWTMDPYGNVYFMSNKMSVYVYVPGSKPQRISQSIERRLQDVNTGDSNICLGWDDPSQSLHVFITPISAPGASTHFTFEQRTQSWFEMEFANVNHSPLVCSTFDGNRPDDRRLLIGSWDGYVRNFDPSATTDDGRAIAWNVTLGPFVTKNFDSVLLYEMIADFGIESGTVNYAVHVGDTAEAALSSSAVASGTWTAGRNTATPVRRSGHAIYVKLSGTDAMQMEKIRFRLSTKGKVRARSRAG